MKREVSPEQAQATYDRRSGEFKSWWADLINHHLSNETLTAGDLAARVEKSTSVVRIVMKSTRFKDLLAEEKQKLGRLPAARETIAAMNEGITITHSLGSLDNSARDVAHFILTSKETIKERTTVKTKDAEGKEIETVTETDTGVPLISWGDKAMMAREILKLVHGKGATIIGKQVNVDNSQTVKVNMDFISPSMESLINTVLNSVPMKQIEHDDGSTEFVLDVDDALEGEGEELNHG